MFSVVIPTRDRVESLRLTLEALRRQTVPPRQLIVVDDGSVDGTSALLESADGITMVVRTSGVGVASARNAGLAAATEEYVIFLDDDDEPADNWLEQLQGLAGPQAGILGCGLLLRTPEGQRALLPSAPEHPGVVLLPGAFAARRSLIEEVGGYMDGLTYAENTELSMRLLPACERHGLELRTTDLVLHTMTHAEVRRSTVGRPAALLAFIERHPEAFAANPSRRARFLSIAGVDLWRSGDRRSSRRLFREALVATPRDPKSWARAAASHVPPVGRYVWRRSAQADSSSAGELGVASGVGST